MKIVYRKETRNELNEYYPTEDWGIEVPDDFSKDNFTETTPPAAAFTGTPCDWIDGAWVLNEVEAYEELRKKEYQSQITDDAFKEAYFEKEFESKPEKMTALQALRTTIKTDLPKE